ncbi:alpha/beta fold hydrolase [Eggerthia catenaformis]|uniref:alpha/beta fold hydrolase n=1 Tax=Eggerthia catenaformis TaxID=31973 RepID=UPI00047A1030|nr:alpha/beta hydrolase [Eggerthia catenaformis]
MKIYYEIHGEGFPVFLLHGNQENRKIYDQLIHDLKGYQLIAVDTRYHGKSLKEGELSLHQFALDIKELADELSFNEYDIIGFSDGANIGLTLSLLDQRLKHMVLMSPNSSPKGLKGYVRFMIHLNVLLSIPFTFYNKKAKRIRRLNQFMLKEPHFTQDELEHIMIPVLLLSGERDMIKKEDIDYLSSSLKYCVSKCLNSTHFLLEDAYKEVLKEIRGFLYACHQN